MADDTPRAVVIPTIGRPSLADLLDRLDPARFPVFVVDDRVDPTPPLEVPAGVTVVNGPAKGPAAARNAGWRATDPMTEWIAFVDDDVLPRPGWMDALEADLAHLPPQVGGSQGVIHVPLPDDRPPTDWERNVKGLEVAHWPTADMAYRRRALVAVGGFDERFPRAYREDADLALRVLDAGWELVRGERQVDHPVRPAPWWISLRLQKGNADDPLMRLRHGPGWRQRAGVPRGHRPRHVAGTAAIAAALVAKRPKLAAALWLAETAEFAAARIAPGPRTADEIGRMLATSAVVPALATFHWLKGVAAVAGAALRPRQRPAAVLLDRDGTLVVDVPYNGDPDKVVLMPGAREALDRLRRQGIPTAVVSNQSGVARGLLTPEQVEAVNRRIEELLGPTGPWVVCMHGPDDGCQCRKPRPGLVVEAARRLGVAAADGAVIGDIGADVAAARAAGARSVLVPTSATLAHEIAEAPVVAPDIDTAVRLLLGEAG